MSTRTPGALVSGALKALLLAVLKGIAFLFSGFRLGRTMRSVSIPRMEEHPLRAALTIAGIAIGVALLVAVTTVNQSILRGVSATIENISGKADLEISAGGSGFDESLIERVSEVPGVMKRSLSLQQVTTIQDARAHGERLLLLGIDVLDQQDAYFRNYESPEFEEIRKDPIPFLNADNHVLLSRGLAERLGYKLHDEVLVATASGTRALVIWGFLDEKGVGHAFGGAVGVMYYQAMQAVLGRDRNVDRIDVAAAPSSSPSQLKQRLQHVFGTGFVVSEPSTKGERVGRMLISVQSLLSMASLIALLVATFLIHNTMSISVVQRKHELAVLRALGTRRSELLRLLTLEGAALGFTGALVGVALGMALARGLLLATSASISELYLQVAANEVHWNPMVLVGSLVAGVAFASGASALAARRSARIKPAEALRTGGLVLTTPLSARLQGSDLAALLLLALSGALLTLASQKSLKALAAAAIATMLIAGIVLLPRAIHGLSSLYASGRHVPFELRLAQGNLPRDVGRTASTAAAIMVGVAMATSFATFAHSVTSALQTWIEQTIEGDLFITNAATIAGLSMREVPMEDTLGDELQALPGVENVRRITVLEIPFRGDMVKLLVSDFDLVARYTDVPMTEGSVEDAKHGWSHGEITVSTNFSERFDVHRGDKLELSTRSGTRSFRVAGVIVDYSSEMGAIGMDWKTYVEAFGDKRVSTYTLHLKPEGDPELLRRMINERFGSRYNLFVLTNKVMREDLMRRVDQLFSLLRALEIVAVIVAMLGIVNALLANVLDRIREIGVLRAVGMLRRQVSKVVLFEAILIGLVGTAVGLCLGTALGYIQLDYVNVAVTGWHFPFRFPIVSCLELAALTLVSSALAGFYPARKAAQTDIKTSLEYE